MAVRVRIKDLVERKDDVGHANSEDQDPYPPIVREDDAGFVLDDTINYVPAASNVPK